MNKSAGKRFEEQIEKSCKKQDIFFLRLKDAGGWNRGEDTRFTVHNLCDCVMHFKNYTLLVELKTHLGKSIPLTALKQYEKMSKVNHNGVVALFILNFRELGETYLITAKEVERCLNYRKSVDLKFCQDNGFLVSQEKLRTNYIFDLKKVFENFIKSL